MRGEPKAPVPLREPVYSRVLGALVVAMLVSVFGLALLAAYAAGALGATPRDQANVAIVTHVVVAWGWAVCTYMRSGFICLERA